MTESNLANKEVLISEAASKFAFSCGRQCLLRPGGFGTCPSLSADDLQVHICKLLGGHP